MLAAAVLFVTFGTDMPMVYGVTVIRGRLVLCLSCCAASAAGGVTVIFPVMIAGAR